MKHPDRPVNVGATLELPSLADMLAIFADYKNAYGYPPNLWTTLLINRRDEVIRPDGDWQLTGCTKIEPPGKALILRI